MQNPRAARVIEQHFLNLPGYYAGAYVRAYVQDTSKDEVLLPTGKKNGYAPIPRLELEIADCDRRIRLEFDIRDSDDRLNSFYKINALINALQAFKDGMAVEAALRRRRLREIERATHVLEADDRPNDSDPVDALVCSRIALVPR